MSKSLQLFWINTLLLPSALLQVVTGLGLLVGLEFGEEVHEINGPILSGLVVAHLVLNWSWAKTNWLRNFRAK